MGWEVRVAGFDELDVATAYRLWRLRADVFVVEQECAYPDLDGRDTEPATRHLWVVDGDLPVGYLRVLEDDDVARVGRVVVATSHRGHGVGEALMRRAHELTRGLSVVLDAQAHLTDWYTRLGYHAVGPQFLDDGIPHVPMRRDPATAEVGHGDAARDGY
jgi:ElaA protein